MPELSSPITSALGGTACSVTFSLSLLFACCLRRLFLLAAFQHHLLAAVTPFSSRLLLFVGQNATFLCCRFLISCVLSASNRFLLSFFSIFRLSAASAALCFAQAVAASCCFFGCFRGGRLLSGFRWLFQALVVLRFLLLAFSLRLQPLCCFSALLHSICLVCFSICRLLFRCRPLRLWLLLYLTCFYGFFSLFFLF